MAEENELDIRAIVMGMVDKKTTGSQMRLMADDLTIEVEITILSMANEDKKEIYNEPRGDYILPKNDPVADGVKAALDV